MQSLFATGEKHQNTSFGGTSACWLNARTILYCISDDSSASYEKSHTVCRSMQQGGTSTVMARPLAAWNHWTGQRKEPTRSWEYQHRSQQTFIFGHYWPQIQCIIMIYNAVGTPSVEQLSVQTIQTALLCLMEAGVACPSNYLDVGRLFERECAEWTTSFGAYSTILIIISIRIDGL